MKMRTTIVTRYTVAILLTLCCCHHGSNAEKLDESHRDLSSDDFARGGAIVPYTLPWWHPEIQFVAVNEIPGPSDHPLLDDDPAFQRFIRANTGESHKFLDGRRGYIQRPGGLPRGHPNCDNYFIYEELPVEKLPTVHFDHPEIHEAYLNGEELPKGHPSVSTLLSEVLPLGHPDVDDLFFDHEELPSWHPDLSLVVNDNPIDTIYVFSGHPDLDDDIGEPVDDHPFVHHLFESHLPDSHPDIDDLMLMLEGYTLPGWHPRISTFVQPRPMGTSPGSLLCLAVAGLVIIVMLLRKRTQWKNSRRTIEKTFNKHSEDTSSSGSDNLSESPNGIEIMRRDQSDFNPNPTDEKILVYKEKQTTWKSIFQKRIAKSSHSTGNAMICFVYIWINLAALCVSPQYEWGLGVGSLSAGNALITILTASRNSIFTWCIGVAFDEALVYHRFVGRLVILLAFIHSGFYVTDIFEKPTDPITLTGLVCLGCCFAIMISSLNFVRRKFFNVFFWSHVILFVVFLGGLYLHSFAARPFIAVAVGGYCIDKMIQLVRKMPRRVTAFEKMDQQTIHVQYPKSFLNRYLGRHDVGQYVFINIPSLSVHEWHPFSVASGPSEAHIDLYIKALGDHTKKIVEYCDNCVAENKQVKIRSDGPYGSLPFNYRRYGSILFAAGGIGITPILGILRDIYGHAANPVSKKRPSHCIGSISVIWIMPHAKEAELFLDQLNSFHLMSLQDPLVPDLNLSIYATRETANDDIMGQQIIKSRPKFDHVVANCVEAKGSDLKSLLVYACGPTGMVNQLWDASTKRNSKDLRVDFYRETFEF